jgi:hypothetical protein
VVPVDSRSVASAPQISSSAQENPDHNEAVQKNGEEGADMTPKKASYIEVPVNDRDYDLAKIRGYSSLSDFSRDGLSYFEERNPIVKHFRVKSVAPNLGHSRTEVTFIERMQPIETKSIDEPYRGQRDKLEEWHNQYMRDLERDIEEAQVEEVLQGYEELIEGHKAQKAKSKFEEKELEQKLQALRNKPAIARQRNETQQASKIDFRNFLKNWLQADVELRVNSNNNSPKRPQDDPAPGASSPSKVVEKSDQDVEKEQEQQEKVDSPSSSSNDSRVPREPKGSEVPSEFLFPPPQLMNFEFWMTDDQYLSYVPDSGLKSVWMDFNGKRHYIYPERMTIPIPTRYKECP